MMKRAFLLVGLGALATAAVAAAPPKEAGLRERVLAEEACALKLFGAKPGSPYQYRWIEEKDLEGHAFLVLRVQPKRLLLELAVDPDGVRVVERRAWVRRNGQQRLLTEADGFGLCETRLGVPLQRLDVAMKAAEGPGQWSNARWPRAASKTKKHK